MVSSFFFLYIYNFVKKFIVEKKTLKFGCYTHVLRLVTVFFCQQHIFLQNCIYKKKKKNDETIQF